MGSCSHCEKKCNSSSDLKEHERTHTGKKPFSCTQCDKKFTHQRSWREHERTHTGEKPFSCSLCNKKFALLHHLKQHEGTHTGIKRGSRVISDILEVQIKEEPMEPETMLEQFDQL